MLRKFRSLNPVQLIADAAEQEVTTAANLNRDQLFREGVKADGERMHPYRSREYAAMKHEMNPQPGFGNPDAYLTGEMQRQLYVEIRGDKAVFDSPSEHARKMEARDGKAIFGLTESSDAKFAGVIKPHILRAIKDKTGCR